MTTAPADERDSTIAALRKELNTLRSHLRHRLYAVNDGFIIPCLLDMSAAWERMAEAMHIVSAIASRGNLASADETRAIVAFLESLASAFEGPEADLTRTLAAQVARGDDRRGGQ